MKRSIGAVVAGAAAIALTLVGCSGTGGGGSTGGTLSYAISADPGKINPITNATQAGEEVAAFTYESLVSFPPGKDAEGLIAEKWTETPTSVTFTLKQGVLCSDGKPLTADDVKATFAYAADEKTGSPYKGVYFPASGMTVAADDAARTVTFTTDKPQSFLVSTIGALPIVCASGLADPSSLDTKAFGTGPYVLDSSSPGQTYSFTLRKDYTWGPGGVTSTTKGLPQTVDMQVVTSASTQANMLQSGELQYGAVAGTERDRLKAGDYTTLDVPLRPGLLFFNQAEGRPGHDLAVREAIAQAIDRKSVGEVSSAGRGKVLNTLISDFGSACTAMDSSASIPGFDLKAAATALDAAGWKAGSDGIREKDGKKLSLKILYPAKEGQSTTAAIELLQQELAKAGIDAQPAPSGSYTDVIFQGGDWDLVWAPIYTSLPSDWQGILSGEFPPNGGNWTYNTNQQYFDLAAKAQTIAGDASCGTWEQAQNSLFSNLEVLPISSSTTTLYGKGLTFGLSKTVIAPTTLRLTK
ncbi:ABC transporter substrate-binding protein [Leifsonia poae]|uniref:ABC transporter substrate-binding protein n=1 Tax=Leifsonia poae TaxID=110933 RepID=UPI001CBA8567|nr:ABC transporter substrate-binding protein [Leifsonia poae]